MDNCGYLDADIVIYVWMSGYFGPCESYIVRMDNWRIWMR
jgi:hypothetical protein